MLLTNQSFSQQAWWLSVGNVPPLGTKLYPLPLIAFKFFLMSTWNNRSVVWFFVIFRGSFGHFYALTEFSMHLCAWFKFELDAHAPVHINWLINQICVLGCMLRSHARNGNEFQTLGHRWLPAKHWDAWFLNSSKYKTFLKFMEPGMLSWSGINMPW